MAEPVWEQVREWLNGRGIRHQEFADRCKIDRALLSRYLNGHRRPSSGHRLAIARETAGEFRPEAWDGPLAAALEREREREPWEQQQPASDRRPVAPPRELGTTPDELRESIRAIERDLSAPGLTPPQRTQLHRAKVAALTALSRLEERAGIQDHPEFCDLIEDLVTAVCEELGPNAPPGIEARIAERFEHRQVERSDARRVAA